MPEKAHRVTRIVSVVAATAISLACGTNASWRKLRSDIGLTFDSTHTQHGRHNLQTVSNSPQRKAISSYASLLETFLEHWLRMEQGAAANIGMYASGIPMGIVVDKKGPRPAALLGAFALAVGYFPIRAGMIVRSATLKLD